jgi:hypothetical protein
MPIPTLLKRKRQIPQVLQFLVLAPFVEYSHLRSGFIHHTSYDLLAIFRSQLDGSIAIVHFVMKSQPYAELQQDEAEASNSAMSFRERGEHGSLMRPQHWKLTLLLFITAISLIINIIVFTKVATWSKSCSGNLLSQTAFFPHCE